MRLISLWIVQCVWNSQLFLQSLCYLDLLVGLNEVAFYNVVVALDAQTALHVETCFLDIVLTMLERR